MHGRSATVLCQAAWERPGGQVLVLGARPEEAQRRAAPAPRRPPPRYNHYADGHQDWVRSWHGIRACSRLTSALAGLAGRMFVQGSRAFVGPRCPDTCRLSSGAGLGSLARCVLAKHALQAQLKCLHPHAGAGWPPLDRLRAQWATPHVRPPARCRHRS